MIGRIFRMVRTPLTLLILLGVLCYGAWWGYTNILKPVPKAPPTPCVDQSVDKGQLRTDQVVVRVYNGGDRKGLAGDVGRALRERGFRVSRVTNTAENISRTVIIGANETNPEVLLVKGFFKDADVRSDGRVDHSVDVLVGNKYAGFVKNAPKTIAVSTETVCLPPTTPTASPSSN